MYDLLFIPGLNFMIGGYIWRVRLVCVKKRKLYKTIFWLQVLSLSLRFYCVSENS